MGDCLSLQPIIDENRLSIFEQQHWVTAACDNKPASTTVERNGAVIGRILYSNRSKYGFRLAGNPPWTPYGGIVLSEKLSNTEKLEVARELLKRLPNRSFTFQCPSPIYRPDAAIIRQAYEEAGFSITQSKTRVLYSGQYGLYVDGVTDKLLYAAGICPDASSFDALETKSLKKTRSQIRKADRELTVTSASCNEFVRFYEENLQRQGKKNPHPFPKLRSLLEHGLKTGSICIFAARGKVGESKDRIPETHAAIACAFDNARFHLWLMMTRKHPFADGNRPHMYAMKLLLVHAIVESRRRGLVFDTDGGSQGQTEELYPQLRISGEESRFVAARLTRPHLMAKYSIRVASSLRKFARNPKWRTIRLTD